MVKGDVQALIPGNALELHTVAWQSVGDIGRCTNCFYEMRSFADL